MPEEGGGIGGLGVGVVGVESRHMKKGSGRFYTTSERLNRFHAKPLLSCCQQGLLKPQVGIHRISALYKQGNLLREGTCVAKIHKHIHILLDETEQMVGAE
ncbi:hypothetical protein [Cyanobium sp. A2C-AMD]|uniref:hypothetical protein n=1 Tax=Cyanobium sp. A2C-AMD TaxID=2823695 RepID=UPI0020CE0F26|nr:hypothetical protein [Cyanobium sp. A2C-AMD]MCP9877910.1 hypothetical protein [Cyanobium sp. A2C-AMD]